MFHSIILDIDIFDSASINRHGYTHSYLTESSYQLDSSGTFVKSWWIQGVILGGYVVVILDFSDPHLADRRAGRGKPQEVVRNSHL